MVPSISSPILDCLRSLRSLGAWLVRDIAEQSRSGGPGVTRWLALTTFVLVLLATPSVLCVMVG